MFSPVANLLPTPRSNHTKSICVPSSIAKTLALEAVDEVLHYTRLQQLLVAPRTTALAYTANYSFGKITRKCFPTPSPITEHIK